MERGVWHGVPNVVSPSVHDSFSGNLGSRFHCESSLDLPGHRQTTGNLFLTEMEGLYLIKLSPFRIFSPASIEYHGSSVQLDSLR